MLRDLLQALRSLVRTPAFSAAVVLLVALGVAVNAAVYAVGRALVFHALPYDRPEQLVSIWRASQQTRGSFGASWPHLADWRTRSDLFQGVEAYTFDGARAVSDGESTLGTVAELSVTEGFFRLLGIRPLVGRLFSEEDYGPAAESGAGGVLDPAIVSYDFWRRQLAGRLDAVGRAVTVNGSPRLVVAVLPSGTRLFRTDVAELYSPLRPFPGHLTARRMTYLQVIARLRPDVSLERARSELAESPRRSAAETPSADDGLVCRLDDLREHLFGSARPIVSVLLGTAWLVLLAACGSVAILMLVRGAGRRREFAVRAALGASRGRLARRLLLESLAMAVAGAAAGLLAAAWIIEAVAAFARANGLDMPGLAIDLPVALATAGAAVGTGALFGAGPPFLQVFRVDLNVNLRSADTGVAGRRLSRAAGRAMIVGQVALSSVLLIAAGLLLRSLVRLNDVNTGVVRQQVFVLSVADGPRAAGAGQRDASFWARLSESAAALPGVKAAAFAGTLPFVLDQQPENMKATIVPEGRLLAPAGLPAEYVDVSPAYFRALGIPLKKGRAFGSDPAGQDVVVNESFARECWIGDPLGKRILVPSGRPYTIIGVVGDVRQYGPREAPPPRQIYRPLTTTDVATLTKWPSRYLVVRASGDARTVVPPLKALVASLDPARAIVQVRSLEDLADAKIAWDRLSAGVVGVFGAAALALTLIGLYAVVAHSVASRRRELAVRVALGGAPGDIRFLFLRQAAAATFAGIVIGLVAAAGLSPVIADRLYQVSAYDAPTAALVCLILAVAGLAATYVPARRATRVDPAEVLRAE